MKTTMETARPTLWIAMAILVLSSAWMAQGQQTPATTPAATTQTPATTTQTQDQTTTPDQTTSTPATTKPTADQALPQNQTQIPTIPQTEKTIGLPATHAPKAVKHKWTPTTGTTSALPGMAPAKTTNGKPAGAPTTGSALTQPTTETGSTPKATNAAGSAIAQPTTETGTTPKPTGEGGSAIAQPTTESGATPKPTPTSGGAAGAAIKQPTVISTDAYKWQPGTTSSAIPAATETPETDAAPATGAATENAMPSSSPAMTNFSTTVTDAPGTAIDQPGAAPTSIVPSRDTGTAIDPSKAGADEVHHWLPGTDTSKALPSGNTTQPTMITPGTAPGEQPNTNTAIEAPATATGDEQKWLPTTNTNAAMPDTGEIRKPPLYTPGTKPGEQPNTNTAIEPKDAASHTWAPSANTDTAITDVNINQPKLFVPGVPAGQQPYIHTAVEAPHTTASQYNYKRGMAPGVEKVVLVPPVDTRNFGNAMRQMTIEGHIVIDIPEGWRRTIGPGLLYYVQEKLPRIKNPLRSYDAAIYVGMGFIEPNEVDRDSLSFTSADSFIHSDIVGFKQRYKRAVIKEAAPFPLPLSKVRHVSYIFQSHEQDNAFEEVIYIDEGNRVLALTLSANNAKTFWSLVPVFHKFAQSYQGNIPDGTRGRVQ